MISIGVCLESDRIQHKLRPESLHVRLDSYKTELTTEIWGLKRVQRESDSIRWTLSDLDCYLPVRIGLPFYGETPILRRQTCQSLNRTDCIKFRIPKIRKFSSKIYSEYDRLRLSPIGNCWSLSEYVGVKVTRSSVLMFMSVRIRY